jgi:hypothetical protein
LSAEKKWPIELIKRGKKMSGDPEIIWWQEPETAKDNGQSIQITTAAAARSIGYEAHEFVPQAYPEKLATTIEEFCKGRIEIDDLKSAADSHRSFVKKPVNKPRGR